MTQRLSRLTLAILTTAAFTTLSLGCDSSTKKNSDAAVDGGSDGPVLTAVQARGQYLVDHVIACVDCHTPQKPTGGLDMSKYLAGVADFITLPNGDVLPSRNLTNDATGLKNYSDAEIKAMFMDGTRALKTGDGGMEALNPFMPYYVFHNMTSADADAIVAYLRVVPAINNTIPRRSAFFDPPAAAPPLDLAKLPPIDDAFPEKESAMRGKYLATQTGLCIECHTKHLPPGMPTVLDEAHLFEGGEDFSALFAGTLMIKPVSKNLTSDMTTGLGTWTTDDIVKVLKEAKAKDGTGICPPMPAGMMAAYGGLKAADATDIANYIRSLPPKVNMIVDMCSFPPMAPGADGGTDASADAAASDGG